MQTPPLIAEACALIALVGLVHVMLGGGIVVVVVPAYRVLIHLAGTVQAPGATDTPRSGTRGRRR